MTENITPQETTQEERTMALLAYLLGPFTYFLGPLVIFLVQKDRSRFVAFHSLQALLLQAAVFLGHVVGVSTFVLGVGGLLLAACWTASIVFSILAGLAANRGEWYDIPFLGPFTRQQLRM